MISLKLYRYSFKYLERLIKYVPILGGFSNKNSQIIKTLFSFNFKTELLSGKLFPSYLPILVLLYGSIYFFYPNVFITVPDEHNKYIQIYKTYLHLQLNTILKTFKDYSKYFLFIIIDTKFIPVSQIKSLDSINQITIVLNIINIFVTTNEYMFIFKLYSIVILNYLYQVIILLLNNLNKLIFYDISLFKLFILCDNLPALNK